MAACSEGHAAEKDLESGGLQVVDLSGIGLQLDVGNRVFEFSA